MLELPPKPKQGTVYLLLLTVQLTGVLFIVLNGLPEFRQLVARPGEQLPYTPYHDPPSMRSNPRSSLEYDLEPFLFIYRAAHVYFWWLPVRRCLLQTSTGDRSRRR